ncbi:MAG: zinc ribbon domain-containing protein [Pseudomonadota bacterium]
MTSNTGKGFFMSMQCISCGMPMNKPADYFNGDTGRSYCVNCSRKDGTMKSYNELLAGLSGFLMKMKGLSEQEATEAAKQVLLKMPAWKDRQSPKDRR